MQFNMSRIRQTKSNTSLSKRYFAMTAIETMSAKHLEKAIEVAMLQLPVSSQFEGSEPGDEDDLEELVDALTAEYIAAITVPDDVVIAANKRKRNPPMHTIDQLDEGTCYSRYQLRKEYLKELHDNLKMDAVITLANGVAVGSEEVLLIALHRFVTPIRLTDLVAIYGRDNTALGRIFNWFSKHVRSTFGHLVQNSWQHWKPWLEEFSEVIREKVEDKSNGGITYPEGSFVVFGFIDDTIQRTTRPGGVRWNTLIQMSFYTGYTKHHGLKFQTLELPNGLCMDITDPYSARQNDTYTSENSGINEKIASMSEVGGKQYKAYCDGIFPTVSHMLSKHVGVCTRDELYEN
ncbi:hypothetical protein B484DRAFT_472403, partial [Ochromonadaceae sp. CCMP2298]